MNVLYMKDAAREAVGEKGKALVEKKKVAVLTLAGGVGSRLGFSGPKGLFEIDAPEGRLSLFERQSKKIPPGTPWVIMVSRTTKQETLRHIQHRLCSTQKEVYVIEQEEVPALDMEEKTLCSVDGGPILMPNGNGSVFQALQKPAYLKVTQTEIKEETASILETLASRGAECINIISVDNVLVKIADPYAVGYLYEKDLDIVSAGVKIKEGAKMGLFVRDGASYTICEYIDAPAGEVLLSNSVPLGNIANHTVKIEFLKSVAPQSLPYHSAFKKIPHSKDPHPEAPNAIKKELFIFDGFNLSTKHGVVEYSPSAYEGLKNKEGVSDSVASCTEALAAEASRCLTG